MQDNEQIYLIARFPDTTHLTQAVQALLAANTAQNHLAVLDDEAGLAESLNVQSSLNSDLALDKATQQRLDWHRDNDTGPLLAVQVLASQGRDLRLRLAELGGEMIDAPGLDVQVNDLDVDPGMTTDEPELPPTYGRLSDNNSPTGVPENE